MTEIEGVAFWAKFGKDIFMRVCVAMEVGAEIDRGTLK